MIDGLGFALHAGALVDLDQYVLYPIQASPAVKRLAFSLSGFCMEL